MKTIFYRKVGKRFEPINEYDNEWSDSVPIGSVTMIHSYKNGTSRKFDIDPALAPMVAATMVLGEKIKDIIIESSAYKPVKTPLTVEQREAWEALNKSFGNQSIALQGASLNDIAESILKAISVEAEKLLTNETAKNAYEQFLTVIALSK